MSLTFILFIVYTIIMFFVKWEFKQKITSIVLICGIILTVVFSLSEIGAIFQWLIFLPNKLTNESRPGFWNEYFLIGILMILSHAILIIFSRSAWIERDDSKDDTKIRIILGKCSYCKNKISRTALICPYCKSNLTN